MAPGAQWTVPSTRSATRSETWTVIVVPAVNNDRPPPRGKQQRPSGPRRRGQKWGRAARGPRGSCPGVLAGPARGSARAAARSRRLLLATWTVRETETSPSGVTSRQGGNPATSAPAKQGLGCAFPFPELRSETARLKSVCPGEGFRC